MTDIDRLDDAAVIEIYESYAVNGLEPAEVADEMDIDLADVHEAIAYYYRNSDELMELRDISSRISGRTDGWEALGEIDA